MLIEGIFFEILIVFIGFLNNEVDLAISCAYASFDFCLF
jgi:hypothetical protein